MSLAPIRFSMCCAGVTDTSPVTDGLGDSLGCGHSLFAETDSQVPRLFLNPSSAGPKVKHENRWHDQRDSGAKGLDRVVASTNCDGIRRNSLDGGQKHRSPPGVRKPQVDWNHLRAGLY